LDEIARTESSRQGYLAGADTPSGLLFQIDELVSGGHCSGLDGVLRSLDACAPDFERVPAGGRLRTTRELFVRRER
jgi:hypothetical protein